MAESNIKICCGKPMATGRNVDGEWFYFCFSCRSNIPIQEEKRVFKSPYNLTAEEIRALVDALKPIFQEYKNQFMDLVAEMVATWASENIPRLLKEIEEEEK